MKKEIGTRESKTWGVSAILFAVSCVFWMLTLCEAAQDSFPSIDNMTWWNEITFLWWSTTYFKYWIGTVAIAAIINSPTTACFTLFLCLPVCTLPPTLLILPGMSPYEALDLGFFSGLVWVCILSFSLVCGVLWILFDMSMEAINKKKEVSLTM